MNEFELTYHLARQLSSYDIEPDEQRAWEKVARSFSKKWTRGPRLVHSTYAFEWQEATQLPNRKHPDACYVQKLIETEHNEPSRPRCE
jgi:hypothetical protein